MLFRNLSRALIEYGRIHTTLAKAKSIQPTVEKLITQVKRGSSGALLKAQRIISDKATYTKLSDMVKTRFASRTSGYTRIIKLGSRIGDASEMVYLEFVDAAPIKPAVAKASKAAKEVKKEPQVQEAEVVSEEKPKRKVKKATKQDK